MALILSIETGTEICSVALSKNGNMISLRENGDKNHTRAKNLGVYIDETFRENSIDAHELDAVAVGGGPGSYTGLRTGVSIAKGLCYALGRPLIAIDSLKALANTAMEEYGASITDFGDPQTIVLAPMIDARRMEVYTKLFDVSLNPLSDTYAHILTPDSFTDIFASCRTLLVFGNGARKCADLLPHVQFIRINSSARGMAKLAETAYRSNDFVDAASYEPFYLKNFIVTRSKHGFSSLNNDK